MRIQYHRFHVHPDLTRVPVSPVRLKLSHLLHPETLATAETGALSLSSHIVSSTLHSPQDKRQPDNQSLTQPHTASHPAWSPPQAFQFGQQRTPFSAPPQRAQFNYPPDETNSTRQGEQNRASPPHAFQELEFQRRSANLDAREARLTQREGELRRMHPVLERREQDFSAFCERGRQLFRGRNEGV